MASELLFDLSLIAVFAFVQEAAKNPLSGWFGHQNAFAFDHSYKPARGVDRFLCGTPSVLASIALEVNLSSKSLLMTRRCCFRREASNGMF